MLRSLEGSAWLPSRDPPMPSLNHHHLQYFRVIAREGGLSGAAKVLRLTHSTLSAQLKQLEEALGAPLFDRKGRGLVLTGFGEQVLAYAEAIHRLGAELLEVAEGRGGPAHRRPFRVTCVASLPRTVLARLLAPVLSDPNLGPIEVRQADPDTIVAELLRGDTHVALAEAPLVRSGVHSHLLGQSGLTWYAARGEGLRLSRGFPESLRGAAFVLPGKKVQLRAPLERWLVDTLGSFRIAAEVDDAAMLRVLGAQGVGVFPVRDALRAEVEDLFDVAPVGPVEGLVERYYALSVERRVQDEAVASIIGAARQHLSPR